MGQTGLKLSGGQRQRLAIARAIVKKPSILILDEATSAIDVRSEKIVQAALDRASKGRTTIVVAHRLTTIQKADHIIVLRNGQVAQQGTHLSLMEEVDGVYHRLASAQSLHAGHSESIDGHDEKQAPLSPVTIWTEETLVKEKTSTHEDRTNSYALPVSEGHDDEADLIEGRVRVMGDMATTATRGRLWLVLSEQSHRWQIYVVMVFAALAAGTATPLQAYLFSTLLSLFSLWGTFLPNLVGFWALMMAILALGVGLGHAALGWSTTKLGFVITRTYRKEYFSNMLHKPATFFDNDQENSTGALTSRLSTDPTELQQLIGISMVSLLTSSLSLAGCIAISFAFGWKLTLVALSTTFPVVMVAMIYRMRYEMALDARSSAVFSESARFACESITAIRTVVSLTLEESICAEYEELLFKHVKDAFRTARISVLLFALSDSIPLLCMAFVLWYGGQLLGDHEYNPFQYMIIYIAVLQGGMSAGQWLSLGPNISNAMAAADRIISMREDDGDNSFEGNKTIESADGEKNGVELEFKDVSFQYPTRSAPVLDSLSLKIEKGQFAAIVGPSGSGKSTIISLLERFYTPQCGQIYENGIDVASMGLSTYRRGISLVAQEPSLFSGTIRDNITLGIPNAEESSSESESKTNSVSDEKVHQAAEDAGIHEFIVSLPEGYSTAIGTGGLALSGGQKQRISLARALIRQPGLLLLDEATSSLDSETEARVQAVLDSMKGTRTMVVVAHRLATVQNADVIFVLGEDGKLAEQGDHESLIAMRGVYYNMVRRRYKSPLTLASRLHFAVNSTPFHQMDNLAPSLSKVLLMSCLLTCTCVSVPNANDGSRMSGGELLLQTGSNTKAALGLEGLGLLV